MYRKYFESKNDNFANKLFEIINQVQVYHWQTTSYPIHKALGDYYDSISDLIDSFIEQYQGQFGRIKVDSMNDPFANLDDNSQIKYFIDNVFNYFTQSRKTIESIPNTTNLQNVLDEIISQTNKLRYLLTLE